MKEKIARLTLGILGPIFFIWIANATGVNDYNYPEQYPSFLYFLGGVSCLAYAVMGKFPKWLS